MRNNMESPAILRLPVELQQRILSKLPSKSRLRFVSACKVLSNSFGFSAVHDALNEAKGRTCLNHSSRKLKITYPQLLCLAPSRTLVEKHVKHVTYPDDPDDLAKGDKNDFHDDDSDHVVAPPGSQTMKQRVSKTWVVEPADLEHALTEPFYICSVKFTEARDDILLYVTFPEYNQGSDEENEIHVSSDGVEPSSEYMDKYIATLEERIPNEDRLHISGPSYNKMFETGAVLGGVDHIMLREFFLDNCTECGGARTICPGCGGVSGRWPEAFASCGFDTPCPQCIGYDAAMTGADYTRWENSYESQRAMDEELNIAAVQHTFLSREQWEAKCETKKKSNKKKDSDSEAYVDG